MAARRLRNRARCGRLLNSNQPPVSSLERWDAPTGKKPEMLTSVRPVKLPDALCGSEIAFLSATRKATSPNSERVLPGGLSRAASCGAAARSHGRIQGTHAEGIASVRPL